MRILVVDDEVNLASSLQRGLRAEGFVVDVQHNGEDGLWAATENAYDVIVLDLMLPKLNGYKVLERLRQRGVWTPVLMLTAKDGEYDQTDAFDLGADDYLTKPFSFIILLARIRALLRRGAAERPAALTVADLVLDPSTHEVRRAGEQISLTPKEFSLLEYLMRNGGRVVSKSDIIANVWDSYFDGPLNVVEVYIGYLRKKVDAPYDRPLITTVRGFGYRLESPASGPSA